MEGLCEESRGKELCLELVDIYQVAYLLFLPCLAHAYIHLFLHLPWRFYFLIHTISLVGVCNPAAFPKGNGMTVQFMAKFLPLASMPHTGAIWLLCRGSMKVICH